MDILVKVENAEAKRELICDTCGAPLICEQTQEPEKKSKTYSFYAQFWQEDFPVPCRKLYLEKFICSDCIRLFPDAKNYDLETAPNDMKQLIVSQLNREDYGYFVSFEHVDIKEIFELLDNLTLIYQRGKKIK